ncbi:MAG: hypothetical protein KC643_26785 [Nitrospira sp.]|nr:hypothetical protein [Nitrospira sp.]
MSTEDPSWGKDHLFLIGLLLLSCIISIPFVYHDSFGERDAYRIALGTIHATIADQFFESEFLYGVTHSFGHYSWLFLFSHWIKTDPSFIFPLMNYSNTISFVFMTIPFFYLVNRYWGLHSAIVANVVLMLTPVWWRLSQFGHPQVPAILFMFVGLALLGMRSHLSKLKKNKPSIFILDSLIVLAFSVCLTIRLDAILLFPLIPACLILERYPLKSAVGRGALYCAVPILIFLFFRETLLPKHEGGQGILGTLTLLWHWHNPTRFSENFLRGNTIFFNAYSPYLLFFFLLSTLYLIFTRCYPTLFFFLPIVFVNYIFWLPNPSPGRHFVYLAPTFAVPIAIYVVRLRDWLAHLIPRKKGLITLGILPVFIFGFLASPYIPLFKSFPFYKNPYTSEWGQIVGRLGSDLQQLDALGQPLFVVTDSIPVLVNMFLNGTISQIAYKDGLTFINNTKNDFVFCELGSQESHVALLRRKSTEYENFQWMIDPYNSAIYNQPFNANPSGSHGDN